MEELQRGYYTPDIAPAFWRTTTQDMPRLVGLCWSSQSTIPCLVAITALSSQAQNVFASIRFIQMSSFSLTLASLHQRKGQF